MDSLVDDEGPSQARTLEGEAAKHRGTPTPMDSAPRPVQPAHRQVAEGGLRCPLGNNSHTAHRPSPLRSVMSTT
ncbi:hypothetical protein IMZ48_44885 [Candidatus Bathyarchaeota archaeon]|nr:hypothetical protein [Candidatus Bathyarchaeota archaeon]